MGKLDLLSELGLMLKKTTHCCRLYVAGCVLKYRNLCTVHTVIYIDIVILSHWCFPSLFSPVYCCWCMMTSRCPLTSTTLFDHRGLSRFQHGISRWYTHVGGRGCVYCVRNYGSMLQVSRSTQKLLALSQVSDRADLYQVAKHVFSIRSCFSVCSILMRCDLYLFYDWWLGIVCAPKLATLLSNTENARTSKSLCQSMRKE